MIFSIGILMHQKQTNCLPCVKSIQRPLSLSPFQVLAEGLEVVLFPLELCWGVHFACTHLVESRNQWKKRDWRDLGNSHLHIVHPFCHLGVPETQFHQIWLNLLHEQMLTQVTWYRTPLWWNHSSPAKKSSLVSFRSRPLSWLPALQNPLLHPLNPAPYCETPTSPLLSARVSDSRPAKLERGDHPCIPPSPISIRPNFRTS